MRHQSTLKNNKYIIIKWVVLLLFLLSLALSSKQADARGGIAITGSFSSYHYRIVPGERISIPDVNILVVNRENKDLTVEFSYIAPEGVEVNVGGDDFTIASNSRRSFPVEVVVGEYVLPDDYKIEVSVRGKSDGASGIAIVGGVSLRTDLSVFAEAGWVDINVVTPKGEPFNSGEIKLFLKEENSLVLIARRRGDSFNQRVKVGDYVAKVVYDGYTIAERAFSVAEDEEKDIKLEVRTVYIQNFAVTPQYYRRNDRLASARVDFSIRNVYQPINEARVVLRVYHERRSILGRIGGVFSRNKANASNQDELLDYQLLDEIEIYSLPTLEVGSQSGRFTYTPPEGWRNGKYSFALTLYGDDGKINSSGGIYGQSEVVDLEVEENMFLVYFVWILLIVIISGVVTFLVIWHKKRKQEEIEEEQREKDVIQKLMEQSQEEERSGNKEVLKDEENAEAKVTKDSHKQEDNVEDVDDVKAVEDSDEQIRKLNIKEKSENEKKTDEEKADKNEAHEKQEEEKIIEEENQEVKKEEKAEKATEEEKKEEKEEKSTEEERKEKE